MTCPAWHTRHRCPEVPDVRVACRASQLYGVLFGVALTTLYDASPTSTRLACRVLVAGVGVVFLGTLFHLHRLLRKLDLHPHCPRRNQPPEDSCR